MLAPRVGAGEAGIETRRRILYPRADSATEKSTLGNAKTGITIVAIMAIVLIIISLSFYIGAQFLRRRNAYPKYIPTETLKNRWRRWTSFSYKNRGHYDDRLQPDSSLPSLRPGSAGFSGRNRSVSPALEHLRTRDSASNSEPFTAGATVERERNVGSGGTASSGTAGGNQDTVDRHTSVRSIMTLPVYKPQASETEQVLGREGERAGIDVVLEFPETLDDEEARREHEMNSLYQIRQARRAETAERQERQRLRREARERGDWAEVERLRVAAHEAQQRRARELEGEDPQVPASSARLIAEHHEVMATKERQKRVSSAQYASIGVVRHDGSRVRAGSTASARSEDNRPLLDGAAAMGGAATSTERRSAVGTLGDTLIVHHRTHSASSVLSLSSMEADDEDMSAFPPFAPRRSAENGRGRRPSVDIATPISSPDFEVVSLPSDAGEAMCPPPRPSHPRTASASASRLSRITTSIEMEERGGVSTPRLHANHERPDGSAPPSHPHLLETPVEAPPQYEQLANATFGKPPMYEGPVERRPLQRQLPLLDQRVPSIRVSESMSPVTDGRQSA